MEKSLEKKLPEAYRNVMVTYKDGAGTLTKRGFYSSLDGYYNGRGEWIDTPEGTFKIPPDWRTFNGALLPHGWGGLNLKPDQILAWEYCDTPEPNN